MRCRAVVCVSKVLALFIASWLAAQTVLGRSCDKKFRTSAAVQILRINQSQNRGAGPASRLCAVQCDIPIVADTLISVLHSLFHSAVGHFIKR